MRWFSMSNDEEGSIITLYKLYIILYSNKNEKKARIYFLNKLQS